MIRNTPLRARSDRAKEREKAWPGLRNEARERAGRRCEGCRAYCYEGHAHHAARRVRLARSLADHPALIVWLDEPCHREVHANPGGPLDQRLLRAAVERLTGRLLAEGEDGMAALREAERTGV